MAYFGKEFKFVKEENFDKFVSALVEDKDAAQKFLASKPNQKIEKDGDGYKLVLVLPDGNKEIAFKNGVPFDEVVGNGLKCKSVFNVDGDVFVQVQDFGDKGKITFKREYSDNELKVSLSASTWDGIAYRWYAA